MGEHSGSQIGQLAGSGAVNVTVNVGGSVVTQNDLSSAVRDSLLNGILAGKSTTFSSTAL
jgi:hypothetical protein